jgi:AcrR family transcriptional regulator
MNSYNEKKNTYVRKHLLDALLKLLKKQSIDSIVISNLIEEAGVSRVSFYRNYSSKEDILVQEDHRLFDAWKKEYDAGNENNTKDFTKELLDFYQNNSTFYLALYKAGLSDIIMNTLIDSAKISEDDPNPIAYLKSSLAYMIYGWIHEWMKRGMQESGSELAAMIHQTNPKTI